MSDRCGWAQLARPVRDRVLAQLASARAARQRALALPPLLPSARGESVPLSAEQAFLFARRAATGAPLAATLSPPPMPLPGAEPATVERALGQLMAEQEILRSRFVERGGAQRVLIEPSPALPFEHRPAPFWQRGPLQSLALAAAQRALHRVPWQLAAAAPWRAQLLGAGEGSALLWCFNSLIVDGETLALLFGRFDQLHRALVAGESPPPPAGGPQYADYAQWQRDQWQLGRFAPALLAWRDYLAEPAAPVAAPASYRSLSWGQRLGSRTTAALNARAAALGSGPAALLLALLAAELAALDGGGTVQIGLPSAERVLPGTERVAGNLMRKLTLRLAVEGPADAEAVRRAALEMARVRDLPPLAHGLLAEAMGEQWLASRPWRYLFNYRELPATPAPADDKLLIRPVPGTAAAREQDVLLMAVRQGEGLQLQWMLNARRFPPAAARALLARFAAALNALLERA